MEVFNKKTKKKFEAPADVPIQNTTSFNPYLIVNISGDNPESTEEYNEVFSDESIIYIDEPTPNVYDPHLNMDISLSRGDDVTPVVVYVKR